MRLTATLLLFLTATAVRCESVPRRASASCDVPPAGSAIAFVQGQPPLLDLRAKVERVAVQQASTAWIYHLRDAAGSPHQLTWRSVAPIPGLVENGEYDFHIEYVGGFPSASALVIGDDHGLLFAAATDQAPGDHVLKQGLTGFRFTVEETGCATRQHDRCYDAILNQRLQIEHGGVSTHLMNGQSAVIDGYRVHVLTAQKVTYNRNCADAGLDGISLTIARQK